MSGFEEYPYMSLCQVTDNVVDRAHRLADVIDDEISDKPLSERYFKWLPTGNCNARLGFIGIWKWLKRPHENLSGKDYAVAEFCPDKIPIEIIILSDCTDDETLKQKLLDGADIILSSGKALIAYITVYGTYRGFLCDEKSFNSDGTKKTLSIVELGLFEVCKEDCVTVQDCIEATDKIFYCKFSPGAAEKIVPMVDFNRIVKAKIISRAKTSEDKFSRKDLQRFREFLNSIASDDFYKEIAAECHCSVNIIRPYVDKFILNTNDELQLEIIKTEEHLNVLQSEYEDRHNKISAADARLAVLRHDCADYESKIETAAEQLAVIKREHATFEKQLKCDRAELDELSDSVNRNEKIYAALKDDIAKAKTAFHSLRGFIEDEKEKILAKTKYYRLGTGHLFVEPLEDMFAHDPDFVEYLTTAYDEKFPLLLAGPKAHEIADALSIDLTGTTAAIFDCAQVHCLDDLNVCALSTDKIIALINPLAPNFIAYIPELLSITEKYFIALHLFAEDLRLEPRGLYNYFLPVPTEKFLPKDPHQQLRREAFDRLQKFWEATE